MTPTGISFLLLCFSFLQLVVVPIVAARKGKSGAAWFMLTLIWLIIASTFAATMYWGGSLMWAREGGDNAKGILAVAIGVVVAFLPGIVLLFSSGKRQAVPVRRRRRPIKK